MAKRVCVITDSTADIPYEIAKEYQINIVPIYVRFGEKVYRDGVDLTSSQFYEKLRDSNLFLQPLNLALMIFLKYFLKPLIIPLA